MEPKHRISSSFEAEKKSWKISSKSRFPRQPWSLARPLSHPPGALLLFQLGFWILWKESRIWLSCLFAVAFSWKSILHSLDSTRRSLRVNAIPLLLRHYCWGRGSFWLLYYLIARLIINQFFIIISPKYAFNQDDGVSCSLAKRSWAGKALTTTTQSVSQSVMMWRHAILFNVSPCAELSSVAWKVLGHLATKLGDSDWCWVVGWYLFSFSVSLVFLSS